MATNPQAITSAVLSSRVTRSRACVAVAPSSTGRRSKAGLFKRGSRTREARRLCSRLIFPEVKKRRHRSVLRSNVLGNSSDTWCRPMNSVLDMSLAVRGCRESSCLCLWAYATRAAMGAMHVHWTRQQAGRKSAWTGHLRVMQHVARIVDDAAVRCVTEHPPSILRLGSPCSVRATAV